jgi:hypothetical protein
MVILFWDHKFLAMHADNVVSMRFQTKPELDVSQDHLLTAHVPKEDQLMDILVSHAQLDKLDPIQLVILTILTLTNNNADQLHNA